MESNLHQTGDIDYGSIVLSWLCTVNGEKKKYLLKMEFSINASLASNDRISCGMSLIFDNERYFLFESFPSLPRSIMLKTDLITERSLRDGFIASFLC